MTDTMLPALAVTAYHEAGHAAAHVELGVPVRWATIVPDEGRAGAVAGRPMPRYVRDWFDEGRLSPYTPIPLRVRDRLEREVMTLFAGELAQQRQTGTTEGSAAYIEHPTEGVVIVDGDQHRIIELVDDLSFGDADRSAYYEWLRARTAALLDRPDVWAAVDAVAIALTEHRRLSGTQVRELARAAQRRWFHEQGAERDLSRPGHAWPWY